MYIVTGGAGLIGSAFVAKLNQEGISDIIIVDNLGSSEKWKNIKNKAFLDYVHKDTFIKQIEAGRVFKGLRGIVHMGACSATTETNVDYLMENNFRYTTTLCDYAMSQKARFIYASSAATYGDGAKGYSDDEKSSYTLEPLNPYGFSKQIFDLLLLRTGNTSKVVGLKFFNVFGPNEAHKGNQRSMVLKAYEQIKSAGSVSLYQSYNPEYKDGEQKRDFVYVKDCVNIMYWLLTNPKINGIFNLGSGKARSWIDLVTAVFSALNLPPSIQFIEMPTQLRTQYQYYTESKLDKLKATGCPMSMSSLEDGIRDYVCNYLESGKIL